MKTCKELEQQYKRVLKKAFPLLKFKGMIWNWSEVYKDDPYTNSRFLLIQKAFISTAKQIGHPFYCSGN